MHENYSEDNKYPKNPILRAKMEKEGKLLQGIQKRKSEIISLYEKGKRVRDDGVYRYYRTSAKVYFGMQKYTEQLIDFFRSLIQWDGDSQELNANFMRIMESGTGKKFTHDMNCRWEEETRPIVEAFFHALYMLEMIVDYGLRKEDVSLGIEPGWGSVLYLYGLR
ncbi:hypothetical protein DFP93_106104 [Aneurinibacillus soli]|uniref:Uncharacterized protein n=1 Tax=Aneurinibacillus soli TaxID=1500254 RepID=A0A0U5B8M1_9BACL|nr:hypothetical protein [Aneurinibacillus soli]PYE61911.1 hypothetical protein DFP93_106104 [Aneurinibacillus soli]BAU29727.1 hypothetical protein CB4_03964 [Aneurinibacillus soli]